MQKESQPLNTPAMRQFQEFKKKYPDSIIFFRLGDFYEMFMDDAVTASRILDIALTKRQNQIPMCGIPFHAADNYLSRLISAGQTVVICDQIKSDEPAGKVLQREVVRIVSPGTVLEDNLLKSYENNYLCFIYISFSVISVLFADITTSENSYYLIEKLDSEKLDSVLKKFNPSEIVFFREHSLSWSNLGLNVKCHITLLDSSQYNFPESGDYESMRSVLEELLGAYFKNSQFRFPKAEEIRDEEFLEMDSNTVRNLDLTENQNANEKHHTLFHVLNECVTPGGKRVLKKRILFPTRSEEKIRKSWDKIELLSADKKVFIITKTLLSETQDMERTAGRFRGGKVFPRDFRTVERNIETAEKLKERLPPEYGFPAVHESLLHLKSFINERMSEHDLPAVLGTNTPFIRAGFSAELDKAREAKFKGKDWILALEEKEKKALGMNTLKIRYNKVVGYYIELSRKDAKNVPDSYLKKQTLVTSERFTTPELEDIERTILHAEEIIQDIELKEFNLLCAEVNSCSEQILAMASAFSELDYHLSLAHCQDKYGWVRPEINTEGLLHLEESRHPVVEKFLPAGESFTPNSIKLDTKKNAVGILTGPNMAGKSTFMRQIAMNQILFQMGSYVPCRSASFSIADRLFTRIGSADNLTAGESTFYVEMKESAAILKNRTENSLILFDEIGRGTSTYDGLSLAWAIVENLSKSHFDGNRTKTIFATHYHELTDLEKEAGVFNLFMDTVEKEGNVIFLKKARMGKAKKSFGIYVAKLAGIPDSIVQRASEILSGLENKKKEIKFKDSTPSLFEFAEKPDEGSVLKKEILSIPLDEISPRQAQEILYAIQKRLK
ncbi:MAG TPA: DNA mismatch repair protein MutS [Leptospiraceae bacterium]|nr:DNA mismatch repair protein MutS [Leptospiraceae bacterium]